MYHHFRLLHKLRKSWNNLEECFEKALVCCVYILAISSVLFIIIFFLNNGVDFFEYIFMRLMVLLLLEVPGIITFCFCLGLGVILLAIYFYIEAWVINSNSKALLFAFGGVVISTYACASASLIETDSIVKLFGLLNRDAITIFTVFLSSVYVSLYIQKKKLL
jgi:hypothetical protein